MPTNIDDKELARLEALAVKASPCPWFEMNHGAFPMVYGPNCERVCRAVDNAEDSEYIAAACNAVPALVAEVRRLRAEVKQGSADYCALMDKHDAQFVRAEKLREEVNWLAKMCATHCRDKSFDNAQCSIQDCAPIHCYHASAEQWKEAAREAVHVDR